MEQLNIKGGRDGGSNEQARAGGLACTRTQLGLRVAGGLTRHSMRRSAGPLTPPHTRPHTLIRAQEARRVAYFLFHNLRASRRRAWIQQSGAAALQGGAGGAALG